MRKDFPDLHSRVVDGKESVTKAAVKAGFYPKRTSVNLANAKSAAGTIIKAGGAEYAKELLAELKVQLRNG